MEEIAGLLRWGGFSGRALATRAERARRGCRRASALDPRVALVEDIEGGVAPAFQAEGFARPARVPLIDGGALVGSLVSPRTAREFGLARERRQRRRDARGAGDGRRRRCRRATRSPRSTPGSRSATCGISTTPTAPPAG